MRKKKSSAEIIKETKSKVDESSRTLHSAQELTADSKKKVKQSKANLAQMKKEPRS
jgi:hypothetical protein